MTIPRNTWKVGILYSIIVRQAALSKAGFEYLEKMKKNTESTGTIFDAQPSELKGNIRCISNPAEPVIGYFDLSDVHEKRIFIKNSDLPNWIYNQGCQLSEVDNHPDSIALYGEPTPTVPSVIDNRGNILKFYYSSIECIYCTERGTNQKPSFWP